MKRKKESSINDKGMAVLEMIPVIIVVMVVLRYSYGFFGVIHASIMQSIASRNYAFETFRHRSRLVYLREGDLAARTTYKLGARTHGIREENATISGSPQWDVTAMDISFPQRNIDRVGSSSFGARKNEQRNIASGRRFSEGEGANPVWLSIRYGMCIDYHCGD